MDLGAAGLLQQPFRLHGKPLITVPYEAQQDAGAFLQRIYSQETGLGLLQGPVLSGKTTIIRTFVESLHPDSEVAVVDASGLTTTALLKTVLSQFGYQMEFNSVNELVNMLKVYVLQRTASAHPPLLIIENTNKLHPSALHVVCELAELRVRHRSALRLVLVSDCSIDRIFTDPAMDCIAAKITGRFDLGPMNEFETTEYLQKKLRAGGRIDPESVIPQDVSDELHAASGGWPGVLDRLVLLALAKAPECPLAKEHIEHPALPDTGKPLASPGEPAASVNGHNGVSFDDDLPHLILTKDGETAGELTIDQPRVIVGRSSHNDLRIDSKFISRHHAMFICHGAATFLMDLNSTNGTYVNSCRISNQVLVHDDVISMGNYRIKFMHPSATDKVDLSDDMMSETVIMKDLKDLRMMLAQDNTLVMPLRASNGAGKQSA